MTKKYFLILFSIIFFTACGGPVTPSFKKLELTKSTEFRYKNDFNKSIFLPKNKKICVVNVKGDLAKVRNYLQSFMIKEWKGHVKILKNCVKADFHLKLYTSNNFYGNDFNALKLTILQRKAKKVVADYTIGSTSSKRISLDNSEVMKSFAEVFLNKKRIFGK